jgi:RsiW-degrading membrane proteinase PrsW (M82 family)
MGLLALAIAPGIAICLFIYRKDKYNKEPIGMLVLAFVLGILSIIPAGIVEYSAHGDPSELASNGYGSLAFFTFVVVAISEEGSKFLMLRLFLFSRKSFDDPFDGIVYAVMVGMGFATIENIGYVYEHGVATGILRMFPSVPAHGTFAVLMGYFLGYAKFTTGSRLPYYALSLLMPILFHGAFDFFLFSQSGGLILGGALASFATALILSFRAIRRKQAISKVYFEEKNKLAQAQQTRL